MPALLCPGCSRKLNVPDTLSGKKVRCPACSAELSVPATESATVPPVARPASETETVPPAPSAGGDSAATVPPADPNATVPPAMGRVVGQGDQRAPADYEVLGELGRGGMGVVYKARHRKLNRLVALKMILSGAHAGEDEMARFATEAEAIARLQHPGIVQVYEVGEHDGRPFFALEFCPGGALDKKLAGTPMQPKDAAKLVQKLAEAMQEAHDAKVIHRDLKPANVLMGADGTPKVTDFGLAKKLDEVGKTVSGAIMGTPSYMAPEQASGAKDIGPAADVYALGAILYECLTGRPPFRAATPFDTIMQVVSEEPVPLRQLNAKVPRDLETIALKCLAKEPAKRYASARELGRDLGRFLAGEPIEARPARTIDGWVKLVRRNKTASLMVLGLMLGTCTVSTWFGLSSEFKSKRFKEEARQAKLQSSALESRASALQIRAEALETREVDAEAQKTLSAVALNRAETALFQSLSWPLGKEHLQDEMARTSLPPLDPLEQKALWKLRFKRSERGLRLLESGLNDPASAVRLGRQPDRVIAAVVGLNPERRRQAEALVARKLQGEKRDEVALACAWLGLELNCRDRWWAIRSAEVLVAAKDRTTNPAEQSTLLAGLEAVHERLHSHTGRPAATPIPSDRRFVSTFAEIEAIFRRLLDPRPRRRSRPPALRRLRPARRPRYPR